MSHKLRNKPRAAEKIGAGFFVFGRCLKTGRVHPSPYPFEHSDGDVAMKEAARLAMLHPGKVFEVFCRSGAAYVEAPADAGDLDQVAA